MAINRNIIKKVQEKSDNNSYLEDSIMELLTAEEEGRQLKRVLDKILSTL